MGQCAVLMEINGSAIRRVEAVTPFPGPVRMDREAPYLPQAQWPAYWLVPPGPIRAPWVGEYRLKLGLEVRKKLRLAATADERYELWLNGVLADRGPDRGDRGHWYYACYEMDLAAGFHELVFRVWAWGELAPTAQISVRPGLLVAGYGTEAHGMVSTGVASWEWRRMPCWSFPGRNHVGPQEHLDFRQWPDAEAGWVKPERGHAGNNGFELYPGSDRHLLAPTRLRGQRHEWLREWKAVAAGPGGWEERWGAEQAQGAGLAGWQGLSAGRSFVLEPRHQGRVLIDLGDYVCGRIRLSWRGGRGALVRALWAEAAMFGEAPPESCPPGDAMYGMKGDRARWEGGWFRGFVDSWVADGQPRRASTLWWRSGRFLVLDWIVGEEGLVIESLEVETTGADFQPPEIRTGDAAWDDLAAVCVRVLRSCAHETTMDCPHYEQLAYAGDARTQLCCWRALCPEDGALALHTLRHFHASALNPGWWTASSAPSRGCQIIPPFSLWWVAMAADHVQHTGEIGEVVAMLPVMRGMVERWLGDRDAATGLCRSPAGWNFADSAYGGGAGVPPGGEPGGVSGMLNWVVIHGLEAMAELEGWAGEPVLRARLEALAGELAQCLVIHTWDRTRGALRDAPGVDSFSEQVQALALLTAALPGQTRHELEAWLRGDGPDAPEVLRCQAFMSFYLFRAARAAGAWELIRRRLGPWWEALDRNFLTTPETFGRTRSDAHAWGAHPVLFALEMMKGGLDPVRLARPGR